MTIRSGSSPRGQAPRDRGSVAGNGRPARGRRSGSSGSGGPLRIVLFLAIIGAIILVLLFTVARPLVRGAVVGWAGESPSALGIGWVSEMVREDLGSKLTDAAGSGTDDVEFTIESGDTVTVIADRLVTAHLLKDARAFVLVSLDRSLTTKYQAGLYTLRESMTPDQLASALLTPHDPHVVLDIRTGLRLEQIAALIQAKPADKGLDRLQMDASAFLEIVRNPPATLLADYPWLVLPKGASLEGYLAAGGYSLEPAATPETLVRAMLDRFYRNVGADRLNVAKERGLAWTQVLTLASIVERETPHDAERAKIAGVFQNRLTGHNETAGFLGSDPTVFYVNDTIQLSKLAVADWPSYLFWGTLTSPLPTKLPAGLAGYNTYTSKGLPPGPICTPTTDSIDAALAPDTAGGYLYFLATKDGTTVFAKTKVEHQANIKKYGA